MKFFCLLFLCFLSFTIHSSAQDFKFEDENDKFYDEPVDTVSGRWERIYRGNDTLFYVTKTAVASTINVVQLGAYNYLNTLPEPRRWGIRVSEDGGKSWNQIYSDSTVLQPLESIEFSNLYYPSPSTIIVVGFIQKFEKFDSNFNPIFTSKGVLLRTLDFGKTWIFDTTFFQNKLPNDHSTLFSLTTPNQGLILARPENPSSTNKRKLYQWNYYYVGNDLIDTLFEVPFPDLLQNAEISEMISGGPGPRKIYLFTDRNLIDDPPNAPSGAYTSDGGLTWVAMKKNTVEILNRISLQDNANTDGILITGGRDIFFEDDRGAYRAEEVVSVSTDGGVTRQEIWRKRRAPFNGILHCKFADDKRGMFVINRTRNWGAGSVLTPEGIPDTVGFYGYEPMIYRTDDGGVNWVREPFDRKYHPGSPISDINGLSGIRDIFYRRDASGQRLRLITTPRDVFRFEPIKPTSVANSESSIESMIISISPNPTNQKSRITYRIPQENQQAILTIHDALGMEVLKQPLDNVAEGTIEIPTSSFANGTYHVRIRVGTYSVSQLLIVHK